MIERMDVDLSEIFSLIAKAPGEAAQRATELLKTAVDQKARDAMNWVYAYALVELGNYEAAEQIWREIYQRTKDHKALHQIGYVRRRAHRLDDALLIFETDPIERACFYRLKGDLLKCVDSTAARLAYTESLRFFEVAGDFEGASEIKTRLSLI